MDQRIKCGVLGAGWWATFAHIPALKAHPRADLIALQTLGEERARGTAAHFGVPYAYTSPDDLLRHPGLDALVISSVPRLRYCQTKQALQAGKHVLLEKPMTFTASEARELVSIASERRLQLIISCPWHYTAHGKAARTLIRSGEVGEVRLISVLMTNPVAHLLRGVAARTTHGQPFVLPDVATYSDPEVSGGGQSYAQLSHVMAYIPYLTGAEPQEVFARFHNDGSPVDLYDVFSLQMNDGALVSIASTGVTADLQRDFEMRIFGTLGTIYLDLWKGMMRFVAHNGSVREWSPLHESEVYPHFAPAHNLIDSVLDPSVNQSPGSLGATAIAILEAGALSASEGKPVQVADFREVSIK